MPRERVLDIAARLRDAGAQEIGFGDTTGMANPRQVSEFFPAARAALGDEPQLTAHFHNTRGQGLANVLAALDAGVDSFESSFGELGGCPVPAGATGNIATEDLVSMLARDGRADRHRPAGAAGLRAARAGGPRQAAGQPHAGGRAGRLGSCAERRWRTSATGGHSWGWPGTIAFVATVVCIACKLVADAYAASQGYPPPTGSARRSNAKSPRRVARLSARLQDGEQRATCAAARPPERRARRFRRPPAPS